MGGRPTKRRTDGNASLSVCPSPKVVGTIQVENSYNPVMLVAIRDLRFALRMFAKSPWTTAVAVLSLALAIGPNAALFSVLDSLILRPQPAGQFRRTFDLRLRDDRTGAATVPSYPDLLDYQSQARHVGTFIAYDKELAVVTSGGRRDVISINRVTENYFSALGATAALGRTLRESDATSGGMPPVVISHSFWLRQFGGAADTIGKTVFLDGQAFVVLGIMPRGFRAPGLQVLPFDAWTPLSAISPDEKRNLMRRGKRIVSPMVVLPNGMDRIRAEAVLTTVSRRLASQYPETNKGQTVRLASAERGGLATIVLSLVSLVLLIACANVAGILLARGEARRREFCVRLAIGGSRSHLVRQLLTESLLLAIAAGAFGSVMALTLVRGLIATQPFTMASVNFDFRVDSRVLGYILSLSLITTLAAGLFPALRLTRPDLVPGLRGDTPTAGRRLRLRGALVIAQVTVSQFLLIGAALLVRSYQEVQQVRPGFDPNAHVLVASLTPESKTVPIDYPRLIDSLRALPGVRRVTAIRQMPFSGSGIVTLPIIIPGMTSGTMAVSSTTVGPHYLSIMRARLLRGRDFDDHDSSGTVVVNETMAHQIWGGPDAAMGKVFRMGETSCRVIGVAEDGKYVSLSESPRPFLFAAASLDAAKEGTLLIETTPNPIVVIEAAARVIRVVQPRVVGRVTTLSQYMRLPLFPFRVAATWVGAIAILGAFLAGVGLHALVSYSVVQRTSEIGLRVALGAKPLDILALVLRRVVTHVGIGTLVGIMAAWAMAQVATAFLYRVSPADPAGLAAAVMATLVVALLAAYAPTLRALRVDPMNALRQG